MFFICPWPHFLLPWWNDYKFSLTKLFYFSNHLSKSHLDFWGTTSHVSIKDYRSGNKNTTQVKIIINWILNIWTPMHRLVQFDQLNLKNYSIWSHTKKMQDHPGTSTFVLWRRYVYLRKIYSLFLTDLSVGDSTVFFFAFELKNTESSIGFLKVIRGQMEATEPPTDVAFLVICVSSPPHRCFH